MEFTEPLSDCRTLANRIGSENLKRPAAIGPSVSERCTASAPQAPGDCAEPGGEQRPARPLTGAAECEPQRGERHNGRAEGEDIAPARGAQLGEQRADLG